LTTVSIEQNTNLVTCDEAYNDTLNRSYDQDDNIAETDVGPSSTSRELIPTENSSSKARNLTISASTAVTTTHDDDDDDDDIDNIDNGYNEGNEISHSTSIMPISPPTAHNGGHYPNNYDGYDGNNNSSSNKKDHEDVTPLASPLGSYLKQMAMEKMQTPWALDNPCQTLHSFEDAIQDMNCQQILPFFHYEHHHHRSDTGEQSMFFHSRDAPIGPDKCEYCESLVCDKTSCRRPRLYFLKKKSPFDSWSNGWDKQTEYKIDPFGVSSVEGEFDADGMSVPKGSPDRKSIGGNSNPTGDNDGAAWSSSLAKLMGSSSWGSS